MTLSRWCGFFFCVASQYNYTSGISTRHHMIILIWRALVLPQLMSNAETRKMKSILKRWHKFSQIFAVWWCWRKLLKITCSQLAGMPQWGLENIWLGTTGLSLRSSCGALTVVSASVCISKHWRASQTTVVKQFNYVNSVVNSRVYGSDTGYLYTGTSVTGLDLFPGEPVRPTSPCGGNFSLRENGKCLAADEDEDEDEGL